MISMQQTWSDEASGDVTILILHSELTWLKSDRRKLRGIA